MNRSRSILLLLFSLIHACICLSQLDSASVHKFAKFLESSKEYEFAAEEFDRLFFLYPENLDFFLNSIKNYRLAGKIDRIESRILNQPFNERAFVHYILSKIDFDDINGARSLFESRKKNIDPIYGNRLDLDLLFYESKYKEGLIMHSEYLRQDDAYRSLLEDGVSMKVKSPILAGFLSGILPGLGRVYAKDYIDGIISMIFVGSFAYQAYSRFSKKGTSSVSGWIYGGIGLGFYIGNIYGSVKSAQIYNSNKQKQLNAKAKSHIDLYYSDL